MSTPGKLLVTESGQYLNSVVLDQGLGDAHNEVVTIGDPSNAAGMAPVTNCPPSAAGYGLAVRPIFSPSAIDLSGRSRGSQLLTLFDGKIMGAENTNKWDTKGTGTAAYANNAVGMSVTAGQYLVRQGKFFCPYFSGKPQLIESTSFNFQNETGVVKRIGYFSSNAVAPYDSNKDGWWLEADGTTHRLICSRDGTVTHNIPWAEMDAVVNGEITSYDWEKFTVTMVDFLWLGGAGLRFFLVVNGVFKLIHTIDNHAGYQAGLIFLNPNQPVRYEIRSSTGSGSLTSVCSQVATEGSTPSEHAEQIAHFTASVACNAIGTIYALAGMRKVVAYRNRYIPVTMFGATNILPPAASPESGMLLLYLNPTLSADLTWTATSRIETGLATAGQTITAGTGRIIAAIPMSGASVATTTTAAMLRDLPVGIDNTIGQIILGYTPYTATQNIGASMQALEY